ncbi:MAG: DUF3592 domain-containing protein [Thermoclostridium sp.]|nr:DUF3592 domain-containing protein [Thermoclostridium sp.]
MVRFQSNRRGGAAALVIFLIVGVLFLIIGLRMYSSQQNFAKTGVTVEATVINIVSHKSSDSVTYRPEVEFRTKTGETIQVIHNMGSNPSKYKKGDVVNVIYSPDNPYEIMMDSAFEKVVFPLTFIGLGGICCLVALGLVVGVVKRLLIRGITS